MKAMNRILLMALCLTLIAGPAALLAGADGVSAAQEMRVAIVKSLKGSVTVLKSGGSKTFKAFKNMSLNEGDQISTGKDGSVELELSSEDADKDNVTIGASSQVNFTKLKDTSGTKTKMSVWAGSLWLKVKSVSNANDQFEVETPTSIMGVRGTQLGIFVNPLTGLTETFVASGVVQATSGADRYNENMNERMNNGVFIYPTQQITEAGAEEGIETSISIININEFIKSIDPEIIRKIIEDAENIRKEQEKFLNSMKDGMANNGQSGMTPEAMAALGLITDADLQRITNNFNIMVSLIAQEAINNNKVNEAEIKKLIDGVNAAAGMKVVDIDKKAEFDLTLQEKEKQKKADELRKAQEQKLKEEREAAKNNFDKLAKALKDKAEEAAKKKEENKKELEKQKEAAAKAFFDRLNEIDKKKFDENRANNELPPLSKPNTGSGSSNGNSNGGGSNGGSNGTAPAVSLKFSSSAYASGNATVTEMSLPVDIDVELGGFTNDKRIYGYQVVVEYDKSYSAFDYTTFNNPTTALQYRAGGGVFKVEPEGASVSDADSVDDIRVLDANVKSTVVYSVTKFKGNAVEVDGKKTVVKLPFVLHRSQAPNSQDAVPVSFKIVKIVAVDEQGNPIAVSTGGSLTLQVKFMQLLL
ncbi:hypothetical protein PAECIP111893_02266 [Paenibacillus plantiphilus]|uniref:FecR protein domain-containing protein n=1 Tax=Paenibacillus plantiphilus TaxID=2905650 RepID=A0ABN8GIZ0_9BACL|nr:FecR domain-containing protein [Paenibacillus plantiphilus]CAH1204499.1 hypothetical protein PAECIP111893_02266 [Paenibacillus plantiphilus]